MPVLWQGRGVVPEGWLSWAPLEAPVPALAGPVLVVLALAGVTRGDAAALARNTDLALAACEAARIWGARQVFLCSSAAVYGRDGADGRKLHEDAPAHPASDYGHAKLEMEHAVAAWAGAGRPAVSVLRIGNVLGADAVVGRGRRGEVVRLDPVPGQKDGPRRSYIGPLALARVLAALCARAAAGEALPFAINIAAPGAVGMADLLTAAGIYWQWGPENPGVLPHVELDTARLEALLPGLAGTSRAEALIADWRAAGMEGGA